MQVMHFFRNHVELLRQSLSRDVSYGSDIGSSGSIDEPPAEASDTTSLDYVATWCVVVA